MAPDRNAVSSAYMWTPGVLASVSKDFLHLMHELNISAVDYLGKDAKVCV